MSEDVSCQLVSQALQADFQTVRTTNIEGQADQPDAIDILNTPAATPAGQQNPPSTRREVTFDLALGEVGDPSLQRILDAMDGMPDL